MNRSLPIVIALASVLVALAGCRLLSTEPSWPERTPEPGAGAGAPPIIVGDLDDDPDVRRRYAELGLEPIFTVGTRHFDPQKTERWQDPGPINRYLDQTVPPSFAGYICLDWEGEALKALAAGPGNPEFQRVLDDFVRLARHVKSKRPRAKVGYYSIPVREYWHQDAAWRDASLALGPLVEACDVFFPSCYDFYSDATSLKIKERDKAKFSELVRLALEVAGSKPVLPFVNPRYHHSSKKVGGQVIPDDEFINHIRNLASVEYDGRRIAGVVAWGREKYYHRQAFAKRPDGSYKNNDDRWKRRRAAYASDLRPGETIDQFCRRRNAHVYRMLSLALGRSSP